MAEAESCAVDLSMLLFLCDDQRSTGDLREFGVPPTQEVEGCQRKGPSSKQVYSTQVLIPLMTDSHLVHGVALQWSLWRWGEWVEGEMVDLWVEDDAMSSVVYYDPHNKVALGGLCASPNQEAEGFQLRHPTHGQRLALQQRKLVEHCHFYLESRMLYLK